MRVSRVSIERSHRFILVGLGTAALLACESGEPVADGADVPNEAVAASPADPENAAQVAVGERIYQANCASCHGQKLEGQPKWRTALLYGGYPAPPHNGTGHTWHHGDQHLFDATKLGGEASAGPGEVSRMPGFGEILGDEEIWATLAYIKSHWSPDLRERQRQATAGKGHHHGDAHSDH